MQRHPLGIVDALGEGLIIAQRALVALSIPVLLDLLLWLGPRIHPAPAVADALARGGLAAYAETLTGTADGLSSGLAGLNLLGLVVLGLVTVPSLMVSWRAPFPQTAAGDWGLSSWGATIVVSLGLGLAGLAVGAAYLVLLVRQMEGDPQGRPLLPETWRGFLRLVRTSLVLLVGLLGLAAPLSLGLAGLGRVSTGAAAMGLMVFSGGLLAAWFYLFFTVDAVILNRVGPLLAIYYSFSVVRLNVWRVIGLVVVINVILAGLGVVWRAVGSLHPAATVAAIGANALMGTAMTAASLVFYRDRYRRWQESSGRPSPGMEG